jgi:hypothetical protein
LDTSTTYFCSLREIHCPALHDSKCTTLERPVQLALFGDQAAPSDRNLSHHVNHYAQGVRTGTRKLWLASITEYLVREAVAGRVSAKLPGSRAFRRWVVSQVAAAN